MIGLMGSRASDLPRWCLYDFIDHLLEQIAVCRRLDCGDEANIGPSDPECDPANVHDMAESVTKLPREQDGFHERFPERQMKGDVSKLSRLM